MKEVQVDNVERVYDPDKREWNEMLLPVKTTIVWGVHLPCGLRGLIQITVGKVYCNSCKETMPVDVYEHLMNAMSFMKDGLET